MMTITSMLHRALSRSRRNVGRDRAGGVGIDCDLGGTSTARASGCKLDAPVEESLEDIVREIAERRTAEFDEQAKVLAGEDWDRRGERRMTPKQKVCEHWWIAPRYATKPDVPHPSKPEAISQPTIVCSVCGLSWDEHTRETK
jgi:hypothetical protein